jgi:hypothetical protein
MDHRDAELTEVVVVLDELDTDRTRCVVQRLQSIGLEVWKVDDDQSVVEGAIDAAKVHDLKQVEHVRYVRSVLTYTVDYPPGDPRDKDGPQDDE